MITLTPPGPVLSRATLRTAGGFCWWYADVVDARGNGAVVIAGFGLPFLPGIAGAARSGAPVVPETRPAVSLALYEAGVCTWYGLVEFPSSRSSWRTNEPVDGVVDGVIAGVVDGAAAVAGEPVGEVAGEVAGVVRREVVEEQRIGASRFSRRIENDEAVFTAELDLPLPHGRARGTVIVRGRARGPLEHDALHVEHPTRGAAGQEGAGCAPPRHDWSPQILQAHGVVDVVVGDAGVGLPERRIVVSGTGYHDRNGGLAPLHALGIDHWVWARVTTSHETRVLYALWPDGGGSPRAFGVVVDGQGTRVVPSLDVEVLKRTRNWLGLVRVDELRSRAGHEPFLHVRTLRVVDDGPFYARALCAGSVYAPGATETTIGGVLETVAPHRVDLPWQRPFVRMRVTPAEPSSSSMWHPLFAGDAYGRVGRLVRSLMRRTA